MRSGPCTASFRLSCAAGLQASSMIFFFYQSSITVLLRICQVAMEPNWRRWLSQYRAVDSGMFFRAASDRRNSPWSDVLGVIKTCMSCSISNYSFEFIPVRRQMLNVTCIWYHNIVVKRKEKTRCFDFTRGC